MEIDILQLQADNLLLSDDPAAGMTDEETPRTADLLKTIAREWSVVIVEHDMVFIRALESRATVLHEGHVLSEGTQDPAQQDQRVIDAYLGR